MAELTSSFPDFSGSFGDKRIALDQMMKKVKELEAYETVIEQIKELERKIEQKEIDAQKKEELKKGVV